MDGGGGGGQQRMLSASERLPEDAPVDLLLPEDTLRRARLIGEDSTEDVNGGGGQAFGVEQGQLLARMVRAEAFFQTSALDRYNADC